MLSFRAVTVYRKIDAMLNFSELDDYGHFAKQTMFANLCCQSNPINLSQGTPMIQEGGSIFKRLIAATINICKVTVGTFMSNIQ